MARIDDGRLALLADEVNARIETEGLGFGPVRIRRMKDAASVRETPDKGLVVTDRAGRRCAVDGDPTVAHVLEHAAARHENRRTLDNQLEIERLVMKQEFEGLTRGRIDVMPSGMMDGRRDSFMVFEVTLDLLDDALNWRPHRLQWQPYAGGDGDSPRDFAKRQRMRLKLLGKGHRVEALRICPVLASRIRTATNPCTWAGMMLAAMEGHTSADMPRFTEGTLHGRIELTRGGSTAGRPGSTWTRDRLSVPDRLPDTVASDAVGRRLGDLVAGEHLPVDATVRSVRRKGGRTIITVDAPAEPMLPVLRDAIARGVQPRPELDIFPGRRQILDRLRAVARTLP